MANTSFEMNVPRQRYHAVIERDEDGYFVASVVELPGCHTQARSRRDLALRIREAIEAYLGEAEAPGPTITFVGVQTVEV